MPVLCEGKQNGPISFSKLRRHFELRDKALGTREVFRFLIGSSATQIFNLIYWLLCNTDF